MRHFSRCRSMAEAYEASVLYTSVAYVSIRQHQSRHTSAYVSIKQALLTMQINGGGVCLVARVVQRNGVFSIFARGRIFVRVVPRPTNLRRTRQHPSASVSIREHTWAYVSMRAYLRRIHARGISVSSRQHTSAYVSIREHT
jgi:hypothetical protein